VSGKSKTRRRRPPRRQHELAVRRPVPVYVHARYDAAQVTPNNRRYWAHADALSADAATTLHVRTVLRNNARYEVANNSYAKGIVLTLANDVIGTGPRLQMLTGDVELNRTVERQFAAWAKATRLAGKLRTMRMARATDGEAFCMLVINKALTASVPLDIRLIEADQVTTPGLVSNTPNAVDGIVFDSSGNPRQYHVLKEHPGGRVTLSMDHTVVPAEQMIHWFRPDRPGQSRGVPELTPALELFAQLRRYSIAVLDAAEIAADFTLFLKTTAPPDGEATEIAEGAFAEIDIERRMMTTLPEGWEPSQLKAEQPTTTYEMFKREILNEIARCLNMPYNIAAGNSSGYNYASGRLDHQTYFKSIRVDQVDCGEVVLDRIFNAWSQYAELLTDMQGLRRIHDVPHQWFWDGTEHVDPAKEANAQAVRLANHTTTLAAEYARQGKDWENELRQRAKEATLVKQLGLSEPATSATTSAMSVDQESE